MVTVKWLAAVCYLAFALRRLMTYLHLFQQEEYDGARFIPGIFTLGRFDRRATVLLAVLAVLQLAAAQLALAPPAWVVWLLGSAVFAGLAAMENDPRKSGKKRLAMTSRARRTLITAMILAVVCAAVVAMRGAFWGWLVAVQILPFLLVGANLLLSPYESSVQKRFWNEAHQKLLALRPKTVGITGSFGKTSVKHVLAHVLETQAPALMTPGSVNTAMGIARIVREQLSSQHRFFICEMGAYGPGSIARLTELVPTDLGIIITIGHAHFERFKTLDTVARAKFELAEAVVANAGKVVVGESALLQPSARQFADAHAGSLVVVGSGAQCEVRIAAVRQTTAGIETDVEWKGASYTLRAPLYGEHQALNIALAFAAACELGVSTEDATIALGSVPQVSHRLEVKRQSNGWVKIDDAYNSNPVGFENAMQLLDLFRQEGGRRILVTPGMVELGAAHDAEHRRIGELAGTHADVLVAVLPERIPTLIEGYRARNPQGLVVTFASYSAAGGWMDANVGARDVVLIENDLPDLYETKLKI